MLKAISTITNELGALNYKGTWNASSNTPTLADGTGAKGDYYVVSTAGTQTFGGVQLFFGLGDWIAYNGAVWQRVEGGSDGNFANVTLTSTDAGATASPLLELYRDSASPAASDTLGEIEFNGEDSAGNKQAYALFHGSILSPTSGSEQGQLHFETATAGALTEKMIIGTTNLVINEIGAVFNVRIEGDTDANLFYTDATNSRVGIGTVTPAAKLDVVGTMATNGLFSLNTFASGLQTNRSMSFLTTGGSVGYISHSTADGSGDSYLEFGYNATKIGSITQNGTTGVLYNITSDYRLKNVIGPVVGSGERIDALEPVEYTWISDGSRTRGFLAHKFQEVYAGSVTGTKDALDADGNPRYQSMQASTSEVIADLVAEIKSLRIRIAVLEAKG